MNRGQTVFPVDASAREMHFAVDFCGPSAGKAELSRLSAVQRGVEGLGLQDSIYREKVLDTVQKQDL